MCIMQLESKKIIRAINKCESCVGRTRDQCYNVTYMVCIWIVVRNDNKEMKAKEWGHKGITIGNKGLRPAEWSTLFDIETDCALDNT